MGSASIYGQVIKTHRNDRVVRVERRMRIETAMQLKDALLQSEDSEHLNTSFVEPQPLHSSRLAIPSPELALPRRGEDELRGHVKLPRCHYNFE